MMEGSVEQDLKIDVAGESMLLLPERAVYWVRRKTLIISDLHIGKSAALRAESVPIPAGTTVDDLARISQALGRTGAQRLLILGDVLHSSNSLAAMKSDQLGSWRWRWKDLEICVVSGNHDVWAGELPAELRFFYSNAPLIEYPFAFTHSPCRMTDFYNLAGHLHPAVKLFGSGRQRERLPCFLFGQHGGVLPAFGMLTGSFTVRPAKGDRIFVVCDNQVVPASGVPGFGKRKYKTHR
jgi:DNA ligase-associated metallophosphoesterase